MGLCRPGVFGAETVLFLPTFLSPSTRGAADACPGRLAPFASLEGAEVVGEDWALSECFFPNLPKSFHFPVCFLAPGDDSVEPTLSTADKGEVGLRLKVGLNVCCELDAVCWRTGLPPMAIPIDDESLADSGVGNLMTGIWAREVAMLLGLASGVGEPVVAVPVAGDICRGRSPPSGFKLT